MPELPEEIRSHYGAVDESKRLTWGTGPLELQRTQAIVRRFLPPPPGVVLDVGGAAGIHACWLAREGYQVHLTDPVPEHVEQAARASEEQPEHALSSATLGDARSLEHADSSAVAVLVLGPLYHLTERTDRMAALREAHRVLAGGGLLFAAAISRFASVLDGLVRGYLDDPVFGKIVQQDLKDGQHRNPTDNPAYFTTAFFHRPEELRHEVEEAGFRIEEVFAIEGPGWLLQDFDDHWNDTGRRERLLSAIRDLETEPSTLGMTAHLLAVGRKTGGNVPPG